MVRTGDIRSGGRENPRSSATASLFVAAIVAIFGLQAVSSSAPPVDSDRSDLASSSTAAQTAPVDTVASRVVREEAPPLLSEPSRGEGRSTTDTQKEGALPGGTTVYDDTYPGIANLDPFLLEALRSAVADAAGEGVEVYVTSGWRSADYQDRLFREAVAEYGSEAEASRWVATAETSVHVSGGAVDLGPADAQSWLAKHGPAYGLCPVYANEPWHFEFRAEAVDEGCPGLYPDPTHDPRLQP